MTSSKKKSLLSRLDPFTYVDDHLLPILNPWNNEIVSWIVYVVFSFVFAFTLYALIGWILQTATPLVIVVSGSMLPVMARGDVVLLHGVDGPSLNVPEVVLDSIDVRTTSLEELADIESHPNGDWSIHFHSSGETLLLPKQGTSDIIVYYSSHKNLEIIHRALVKIRSNGEYFLLTKGDNNFSLDQDCGEVSSLFLPSTGSVDVFTEKSCPSPYPIPLDQVNGRAVVWIAWLGYVKLLLVDGFSFVSR
ncbi:MAG: hypothetical protein AABY11_00025 [archaeon]